MLFTVGCDLAGFLDTMLCVLLSKKCFFFVEDASLIIIKHVRYRDVFFPFLSFFLVGIIRFLSHLTIERDLAFRGLETFGCWQTIRGGLEIAATIGNINNNNKTLVSKVDVCMYICVRKRRCGAHSIGTWFHVRNRKYLTWYQIPTLPESLTASLPLSLSIYKQTKKTNNYNGVYSLSVLVPFSPCLSLLFVAYSGK